MHSALPARRGAAVTGEEDRREPAGGGPARDAQSAGDVDKRILQAVRSLDYGSVEVVVHDSKVVQIERREKLRFDKPAPPDAMNRTPKASSRRPRQSEPRAQ